MSRVDRYILSLFWVSFLAALVIFVTLFLATDVMTNILRYRAVDTGIFLSYYGYFLPEIIHKMLPIASVVGLVLTISSLNKGSELIALFASGLSLFRVSRWIFISLLVIGIIDFVASDRLLPMFTKQKNFTFYNFIEQKPSKFQTIKTDKIWYRSRNTIFNIKTLNAEGNLAHGLTLYFFDESWNLKQLLTAEQVVFEGSKWLLQKGTISVFSSDSSFPLNDKFEQKAIVMTEDAQDLRSTGQTSDLLSHSELSRYISKNKEAGLDTVKYEVDYFSKLSFALAGLVMSLLALPFCVGQARYGGMAKNAGVVLGLVVSYWIAYSSMQTMGYHGLIPPILASWGANLAMTSLGVFFLLRLKK
jgi:lipopolysaccharide export system permease protein